MAASVPTVPDTRGEPMTVQTAPCGLCSTDQLPTNQHAWGWFDKGRPIHPWCLPEMWDRLDDGAKRQVETMAANLRAGAGV